MEHQSGGRNRVARSAGCPRSLGPRRVWDSRCGAIYRPSSIIPQPGEGAKKPFPESRLRPRHAVHARSRLEFGISHWPGLDRTVRGRFRRNDCKPNAPKNMPADLLEWPFSPFFGIFRIGQLGSLSLRSLLYVHSSVCLSVRLSCATTRLDCCSRLPVMTRMDCTVARHALLWLATGRGFMAPVFRVGWTADRTAIANSRTTPGKYVPSPGWLALGILGNIYCPTGRPNSSKQQVLPAKDNILREIR